MPEIAQNGAAAPCLATPVLICFGAFEGPDGHWCVRLAQRQLRLALQSNWGRTVWEHLARLCDGQTAWPEVVAAYARQALPEVSASAFESLMHALVREGVLVEAAHLLSSLVCLGHAHSVWGIPPAKEAWPARALLPATTAADQQASKNDGPDLPAGVQAWQDLSALRRSTRHFGQAPLTRTQWQQLLQCYAAVPGAGMDMPASARRGWTPRRVASAGALYRLKLWLVLLKPCADDVAPGVYEVLYGADGSVDRACIQSWAGQWTSTLGRVARACSEPLVLQQASGWLLVSADLKDIAGKYRNMAYSHALLETGAVLQNLDLIGAGLGVGLHWRAGMDADRLKALCGLPVGQTLLASAVLGSKPGQDEAPPPDWLQLAWGDGMNELPHDVAIAQVQAAPQKQFNCYGRSADPLLACDKALSEAVERYAMVNGPAGQRAMWGSLPNMVHPDRILRRDVPGFDLSQPQEWVPFVDLHSQETAWLPKPWVFYAPPTPKRSIVNTSGMACGPDPQLAHSWAALELFERDAFMRAWLSRRAAQALPMSLLSAPYQALAAQWQVQGCTVFLGQLPSPWAAVVMVYVQHPDQGWTRMSAASDWSIQSAPDKALSEIAASVVASLRGLQSPEMDVHGVQEPLDHIHFYLQPAHFRAADFMTDQALAPQERLPSVYSKKWVERLAAAGLQALACDVAVPGHLRYWYGGRPHVSRVVIPGLLPIVFGEIHLPLPDPVWPFDQAPLKAYPHTVVHPFP